LQLGEDQAQKKIRKKVRFNLEGTEVSYIQEVEKRLDVSKKSEEEI
jgi:hypothetical protein